jgi:predicted transcriptional regulator
MQVYEEPKLKNKAHRHRITVLKDVLLAIRTKGCGITITEVCIMVGTSNTISKQMLFSLLEKELIVDKKAKKVYEQGKGRIKNYYYITQKGNEQLDKLISIFESLKQMERDYL